MKQPPRPVPLTGSEREHALAQERCCLVLDSLDQVIADRDLEGLAGTRMDPSAGSVEVWWQATVPTVLRAVATAAGTASGVDVVFRPADHTERELRAALALVMSGLVGSAPPFQPLRDLGVTVTSGSGAADGSRLSFTVSVAPGRPVPGAVDRARRLIRDTTGLPVELTVAPGPVALTARS